MIKLPEHAGLGLGEIVYVGGKCLVHQGGGVFVPSTNLETMEKRFDQDAGETLHRTAA